MPSSSDHTPLLTLLLQFAIAALCGIATAYQPGMNAKFAEFAGSKLHGGVLNFAIGLAAMLAVAAFLKAGIPDHQKLLQGPWWMWLGGLCGAFFVTSALILVPRMGTTSYLAAMLAGQFAASLIIDRYGHLQLPTSPITWPKVMGIGLIIAGVLFIAYGRSHTPTPAPNASPSPASAA